MELNKTLDQIIWDLEKLRESPDCAASFNALEVTLQDWARFAHNKVSDTIIDKVLNNLPIIK